VDDLIARKAIKLADGCGAESTRRVLLKILRHQAQADLLADIPDPTIAVDDFTGIRAWRLSFGHETLTELQRLTGNCVPFTWESADRSIRAWLLLWTQGTTRRFPTRTSGAIPSDPYHRTYVELDRWYQLQGTSLRERCFQILPTGATTAAAPDADDELTRITQEGSYAQRAPSFIDELGRPK
jgi:hypothetical protein